MRKKNELETSLKEFEAKTRDIKIKKFQHDRKDYIQNRVYHWLYEKKKVTWAQPMQEFSHQDTSDPDTSDCSGDEAGPSRSLRTRTIQQRSNSTTNRGFFRRGHKDKRKT